MVRMNICGATPSLENSPVDAHAGQTALFIAASYGYEEVVAALVDAQVKESEDSQIREVFATFDVDGGGSIGPDEFRELCIELHPEMQSSSIEAALAELDKDGNGEISFDEFEVWWKSLVDEPDGQDDDDDDDEQDKELDQGEEEQDDDTDEAAVTKPAAFKIDLDKAETRYGQTPLYIAAARGHAGVVHRLIGSGCDLDKPRKSNGGEQSPVHEHFRREWT